MEAERDSTELYTRHVLYLNDRKDDHKNREIAHWRYRPSIHEMLDAVLDFYGIKPEECSDISYRSDGISLVLNNYYRVASLVEEIS